MGWAYGGTWELYNLYPCIRQGLQLLLYSVGGLLSSLGATGDRPNAFP